jgi:hypothetical protein
MPDTAIDPRLLDTLKGLPPRLLAALQAVEAVDLDTVLGPSGRRAVRRGAASKEEAEPVCRGSRGASFGKQLVKLKQTYEADLLASLAQVEAALKSEEAASYSRLSGTEAHWLMAPHLDVGPEPSLEQTPLSLLESMAAELLHDRVLLALTPRDLAALGQSCRNLRGVVGSEELAAVWETHYIARWGAVGRDAMGASAYLHRANVEAAWRTTRWGGRPSTAPEGEGEAAGDRRMGGVTKPSTVRTSAVLFEGPQHNVCALGFDCGRGNAVTGDTDGLVRVWDIEKSLQGAREHESDRAAFGRASAQHGRRAVGAHSGLGRDARLAVLRLHKKGHRVRWVAIHGRRLLCSCASAFTGADGMLTPGKLVLVDLDDIQRLANNSMLTKGVAAAAVDSGCGFVGTGTCLRSGGNGFSVGSAWCGVGGAIRAFDMALDRGGPAPAPLQTTQGVMLREVLQLHYDDTVEAIAPLLGIGGGSSSKFAAGTAAGVVCVVDLGNEADILLIDRRWDAPSYNLRGLEVAPRLGPPCLAAVPSVSALVGTWHPEDVSTDASPLGMLRVLDPREPKPTATLGPRDGCPAICDLYHPPDSSLPTVLAALYSGETRAVDLRMLGRSFGDWPVVIEAERQASTPRLAGDARRLLATRKDGALLGAFGIYDGPAAEEAVGETEWASGRKPHLSRKEKKKQSANSAAVNSGARRFPKKNNRRKQ